MNLPLVEIEKISLPYVNNRRKVINLYRRTSSKQIQNVRQIGPVKESMQKSAPSQQVTQLPIESRYIEPERRFFSLKNGQK